MKPLRSLSLLLVSLAFGLVQCSDDGWSDVVTATRSDMLESIAARVILPGLERFGARSADLAEALALRERDPSADSLARARSAWRDARAAWNRLEAGLFDPPFSVSLLAQIDTLDVDELRIEEDIATNIALDRAAIEDRGATRKGFFALEYLLFEAHGEGSSRLAYARATGAELARVASTLAEIWSPAGEDALGEFVGGVADPLQRIANRFVAVAETAADIRLGAVLGRTSGGIPQPEVAESERSENSLVDLRNDLEGIADIYEGRFAGRSVIGVAHLIALSSPTLRFRITEAIERAIEDVEAIAEPLTRAAIENPVAVERAFESCKDLKDLFAVELVTALGTSLTFSPFDGD